MALKYTTTKQLGDIIRIVRDVPSRDIGTTPTNEAVGTGNNSDTQFFLDQLRIVADSYTLYANAVAMTDVTDYSIALDTGEITLTAAGVTLLSTNALTAKYKYFDQDFSDSFLNTTLTRAEQHVDSKINSTFTDGTATNPTYPSVTEIQPSPGYFRNMIIGEEKPLIDIETTLNGDLTDSATTVPVAAGTGADYPISGNIVINSEVISYTGITTDDLTGCTRGTMGTTAAAHTDLDPIHSTLLFLSNTQEGNTAEYTLQPWGTQMNASPEGLFYSYDQSLFNSSQFPDRLTQQDVANRVKLIYLYGYDTVPADITRLTLLFAKRMLMQDNISKSVIAGRNEFKPEMMNADAMEIGSIIGTYIVLPMGNT